MSKKYITRFVSKVVEIFGLKNSATPVVCLFLNICLFNTVENVHKICRCQDLWCRKQPNLPTASQPFQNVHL